MDQHHQQEHVRNAPVDFIRRVEIQSAKHVKVVCIKTLQHKINVKNAPRGNINRSDIKRIVLRPSQERILRKRVQKHSLNVQKVNTKKKKDKTVALTALMGGQLRSTMKMEMTRKKPENI